MSSTNVHPNYRNDKSDLPLFKENYSDNCRQIFGIYEKLYQMIEEAGYNLIDDPKLKDTIERNYQVAKKRIESKWTTCAILEQHKRTPKLIDGLVKERISQTMDESVYLIEGHKVKESIKADLKNMRVNTKFVSESNWRTLDHSSIILSGKEYTKCFTKLKRSCPTIPDLLILVLNSPQEFDHENIKSFLQEVKLEYNDGNFIVVLNNAKPSDCTGFDICDVCYPKKIRSFLMETGIITENRIFKIETLNGYDIGNLDDIVTQSCSHLFKDLREAIDLELDINKVMERIGRDAVKIFELVDGIKKVFDEKKINESINRYDETLKKESKRILEEIDERKVQSNKSIINTMKKETKKKKNRNKDIFQSLKHFFKELQNDLAKELDNLNQNVNNKNYTKGVGKMAKEMFLKRNQNINVESKLKPLFDENFKTLNWENLEEEITENATSFENQIMFQIFSSCLDKTNTDICIMTKDSFESFVKEFQAGAYNTVQSVKNALNDKILSTREIKKHLKKLNLNVNTKITDIKQMVEKDIKDIEEEIKRKENVDLYPFHIGHYIRLPYFRHDHRWLPDMQHILFPTLYGHHSTPHHIFTIESEIINIKNENDSNKKVKSTKKGPHEFLADSYFQKLLDVINVNKYSNLCKDSIELFASNIDSDKYHQFTKNNEGNTLYIMKQEMLTELELLKTNLLNLLDELKQKVNEKTIEALR